ncbi:hypothetical protein [Halobacillus sp. Marseille-P3879]|uniref:hypothetical protein n=1 Tax=Halobacillus TaxID=45667 RepID=UPI000C7CC8A1|nr:hypothetical protein [Halobacillus sp. Marseille-P3879]
MKSIKLNKAFNMKDNSEINFSKGMLLIDDKSELPNWTVSLAKVKEPGAFKEASKEGVHIRLNLIDTDGGTYIGDALPDFVTSDGSVLMKSKGELEG